ncbi:MAG: hypothetical protein HY738_21130 [Bacteroidia bacterium]|nr:hypothetical protein [Bacteroidia bacterium]
MEAIKINVNKKMDGYSFSITPTIRRLIRSLFPDSHPANGIFVAYDTNSDIELYVGKLENYIYPALLGINNPTDLNKKINEILFIDIQTGNVLAKINP